MKKIASFKYTVTEAEIEDISESFKELLSNNGFLTNGKYCSKLENLFSQYCDTNFAVTCNSGTSALELIYRSLDLYNCDVLIPTNTFTATCTPLLSLNSSPVFYDCCDDLNFCYESIIKNITSNTKAIVITHIGGFISPDIQRLIELCEDKNLFLIEDCAHAHGATYKGRKAGSFGIAGAFSFFSTKVMTCGEGGIVTTRDEQLSDKMKIIRDHGQHQDNLVNSLGFNFRMSEVHAIMALSQLAKLDSMINQREQIANSYDIKLKGVKGYTKIQHNSESKSSLYKYTLIADKNINVENLYDFAKDKYNIALAGRTYPIPCHQQLILKDFRSNNLINSEDLSKRIVCLPIYPGLTEDEIDRVIECLKSFSS